jgi:C_GCAxxG_C_C family probable redox protein
MEDAGLSPSKWYIMNNTDFDVIKDAARERFAGGLNCAETVFIFGAKMIGKEELPSIMTGFGAGVARQGGVCGALSGAIAAIGLAIGRVEGSDKEGKEQVYRAVTEFTEKFRGKFGSINCTELCGCDLSTQEGREQFLKDNLHNTVCTEFVQGMLDLLREALPRTK